MTVLFLPVTLRYHTNTITIVVISSVIVILLVIRVLRCTQVDVEPAGHESYDRRAACEIWGLAELVIF